MNHQSCLRVNHDNRSMVINSEPSTAMRLKPGMGTILAGEELTVGNIGVGVSLVFSAT